MLIWSFIIPVVTCLILWTWFRKKTVWWEYLVVFIPSVLVTIFMDVIIKETKISDYHYISEVVSSIRHYDSWNEYIHQVRYVTVGTGKNRHTVRQDCSYVKYHPEYWEMITTSGKKERFDKKSYDYYRKLWGTPEIFIDMHRRYFTRDGDAQEYKWCGEKEHSLTFGDYKHYQNYFKLTGNLYSLEEIDNDTLGLPEYPISCYKGNDGLWVYDVNPVIGVKIDKNTLRTAKWINSQDPKFRVYAVYFKNKTIKEAQYLERYWERGKDNEVVFCIGLDKDNRRSWIYSFSWSPEPLLEGYVKMESKTGTPEEIFKLSWEAYKLGYWKPLEFKDYSYITIDLTPGDYAWIFWLTLVLNIVISVWVIGNEYKEEI